MYAPSSYNDTVTGETLSSVSEKSETYSNEGSNADYVVSNNTETPRACYARYPPKASNTYKSCHFLLTNLTPDTLQ